MLIVCIKIIIRFFVYIRITDKYIVSNSTYSSNPFNHTSLYYVVYIVLFYNNVLSILFMLFIEIMLIDCIIIIIRFFVYLWMANKYIAFKSTYLWNPFNHSSLLHTVFIVLFYKMVSFMHLLGDFYVKLLT